MDLNNKIESSLPLFFIVFSIYIIVASLNLPGVEGYFPIMIGSVMMVSSVKIFASSLKTSKSVITIEKINISNIVKASIALIIYIIVLPYAGYLISTILLGIFIIHALGYKDKLSMTLYPLIIVGILFFSFKILLRVPLPIGFLGF